MCSSSNEMLKLSRRQLICSSKESKQRNSVVWNKASMSPWTDADSVSFMREILPSGTQGWLLCAMVLSGNVQRGWYSLDMRIWSGWPAVTARASRRARGFGIGPLSCSRTGPSRTPASVRWSAGEGTRGESHSERRAPVACPHNGTNSGPFSGRRARCTSALDATREQPRWAHLGRSTQRGHRRWLILWGPFILKSRR